MLVRDRVSPFIGGTGSRLLARQGRKGGVQLLHPGAAGKIDVEDFAGGVESVVQRVAPNAHFVLLEAPPVVGAVLIALDLAGEQARPGMRETLARATVSALGLPAASALNQLRTA